MTGEGDGLGQQNEDDVLGVGLGGEGAGVRVVLAVLGQSTDGPLHGIVRVQHHGRLGL